MRQRKTHEEFLCEVGYKNPNIVLLGEYVNSTTKILCRCKVCGFEWEAYPTHLIHDIRKCPKCSGRYKTHDEFESQLHEINDDILVVGKYINSNTKICFKCKKCDCEWYARPSSVLNGTGCPRCAGNIKLTSDDFFDRAFKRKPNIEIVGNYIDMKTKILCKCKVCKYEWYSSPNTIINKEHGCPNCNKVARKTHFSFIQELNNINPDIEIKSYYKNIKSKLLCECKKCKYQWYTTGELLLRGTRCIKCTNKSKGEDKIEKYLINHNINYICQKKFDGLIGVNGGLLRFDFYLPEYNIVIEYQGQFHDGNTNGNIQTEYELQIQKEHDNRKRLFSKDNNIELLEIWYWDFDKIEHILESRLLKQSA